MKHGNISTGSEEATLAAKEILKFGGNAFDAAVSAIFVSMTSEFALTGAFGGGTLLGIQENSTPFVYDFFVDSPIKTNENREFINVNVDFGETSQGFNIGKGSIATPGNLMGLIEIQKKYGVLSLNNVLQHAIYIANNGVTITSYQGYILSLIKPILEFDDHTNNLFFKNNKLINKGDTFKNPEFGNFLSLLLQEGYDYFYKGEGLNTILKFLDDKSNLTKNDFINYKIYKRKAQSINFNNHMIYTNSSPSHGGPLIIFLLKLLEKSNIIINNDNLINAMNVTSNARQNTCLNPDSENEIDQIFKDEKFSKFLNQFKNNESNLSESIDGFGSTTHVSVLDKMGNAASITTTNGEGCGYTIPEYGIMMNNMLGEEDLNPFGFHEWNKKRRLPTMLSPIIITKDNKPEFIFGSGGSNRIRSANIQVILNLLIHKMNLKDAISSSRLHLEGDTLFYEPGIKFSKNNSNMKVKAFNDKSLFFGGVNAVSKESAIADERRGGHGIIY
jgi:gamma-glutamyltranspeptidase/glutathione hydrolase